MSDPFSRPVEEEPTIALVLAVLREAIIVLLDPVSKKITRRDEHIRSLQDLHEEVELDLAIPKIDPLERGALNAALHGFRFHQHQAEARVAMSKGPSDEETEWRRSFARYSQCIRVVEQLIHLKP